jgi:CspA family cold shock protein
MTDKMLQNENEEAQDQPVISEEANKPDEQKNVVKATKRAKNSREESRIVGRCKWFSLRLGYGFITRCDNGIDVFVHFTAISRKNPKHRFRSLCAGELVEFNELATTVTGPNGRPVRGNPCVQPIPKSERHCDPSAAGDGFQCTKIRRRSKYSRSPRPVCCCCVHYGLYNRHSRR